MKKLILPFVFILSLSFANATTFEGNKKDCHAQACAVVAEYENEYEDISVTELEQIYDHVFTLCE